MPPVRKHWKLAVPVLVLLVAIGAGLYFWLGNADAGPDIQDLPKDSEKISTPSGPLLVSEIRTNLRATFALHPDEAKVKCKQASQLKFDEAVAYWRMVFDNPQMSASPTYERQYTALLQDECHRYF